MPRGLSDRTCKPGRSANREPRSPRGRKSDTVEDCLGQRALRWSWLAGLLAGTGFAAARAENLVGGVEDALSGTLADRLTLAPRLDVASAELRPWQAQRLATKQGHGLGFDLPDVTRRRFGIGQVAVSGVP